MKLSFLRDGQPQTVEVTVDALTERAQSNDENDDDENQAERAPATKAPAGLGVGVSDTADGVRVERVLPGSAADGELARGDLIVEVNRHPVTTGSELHAQVDAAKPGDVLLLRVKRQGQTRFVGVMRK